MQIDIKGNKLGDNNLILVGGVDFVAFSDQQPFHEVQAHHLFVFSP